MESWYVIDPQPTLNGGNEFDEWTDWTSDGFEELLTETQLGKDIFLCSGQFDGERFETEVLTKGIVQSETPDAYTQGWQRQLLTRIADTVQDYKYVKYDGCIWIIMTMPADNTIYNKCVIHLCNYTLKWQDETGMVYYYPSSILDATQYNTGVTGTKEIQNGYIQLMAWVSLDSVTINLERDKRMFIDIREDNKTPTPYVITSKSTVPYSYGSDRRIIRITFTEDEANANVDRPDLWLCDYIDPDSIPTDTEPIVISYKGSPEIRIGGRKTFTADVDTTFTIVSSEILSERLTLSAIDAKTCRIACENDSLVVGSSFKLIAGAGDSATELTVKVIGGV